MKTFETYQRAATSTAIYPDCGEGTKLSLAYTALGLAGEAGEYAEKIKKYIRDGTMDRVLIIKELGDVLWYLSACADELETTLEEVAETNIFKLANRKQAGTLQGSGDTR